MPSGLKAELAKVREILAGPYGEAVWDVLTALRGPDTPSERDDMAWDERQAAYAARRERKARTVEVIRGVSALKGGSCRYREDRNYVLLPPRREWDHFDRHVYKAAGWLGVEVRIKEEAK